MKCLSLMQPYAELVVKGSKTIELRKWNTRFRGKFLVHASKKIDKVACKRLGIDHSKLASGAIIGMATLYGVKKYLNKNEFLADKGKHMATYKEYGNSKFAFMLKNAKKLKQPMEFKGRLNFFDADLDTRRHYSFVHE